MNFDQYLRRYEDRLIDLKRRHLLREAAVVDSRPDGTCEIDGRILINFGGNDYLNFSHELAVNVANKPSSLRQIGATASAAVAGRSSVHAELEQQLARFEEAEAALLFPSGYAANVGVLTSLVESRDAVFCDRDNHASIIDAAKSSDGKLLVYQRHKLAELEESLARRRDHYDRVYIVTDGVFSMDGQVAPLQELCDIADRCDAAVIVDEAHGTGVLGEHGRGACDLCQVEERVLLRVGTLSKGMGGLGGFVVSQTAVVDLLRNTARTQFFSTALPPLICQSMINGLNMITEQPERRHHLATLNAFAHDRLEELGLESVGRGMAPIVPIVIGDDRVVVKLAERLRVNGFFIPAIRPPTVPNGTARLRMSLSTAHTQQQINDALVAVAAAAEQLGIGSAGAS